MNKYGGRRYFIYCNAATSAVAVTNAIASALGLFAGSTNALPQVLAELSRAPAVLVLDNVETPWESDELGTVNLLLALSAVPGLALVSSIRGHHRPRDVPWNSSIRVSPLPIEHAKKLFLDVAGDELRDDPHVDALLEMQDGVPLAIRLLGTLAEGQPSLAGLWAEWIAGRETSRKLGLSDLTSAEMTYEVSFASRRTGADGRRLLSLLSILPNGVDWAALDVLLPNRGIGAASNLCRVGLAFDERHRLRALQPIRSYVRRSHPPSLDDVQTTSNYYLRLGEELGRQAGEPGGADAIDRLANEIGNVNTLLKMGFDSPDPTRAIDAAVAISSFIRFSGLGSTLMLDDARSSAARINDAGREAHALLGIGAIAFVRAQYERANRSYSDGRILFESLDDQMGTADCIKGLAHVARAEGKLDHARAAYREARDIYAEIKHGVGIADSVAGLADLDFDQGDMASAESRYAEARAYYEASHMRGVANCLAALGEISLRRAQHDLAHERFLNARPLYAQVGHVHGVAKCELGLGRVAFARGNFEQALSLYEAAEELYLRVGARREQAEAILGYADAVGRLGQGERSRAHYERASSVLATVSTSSQP
ncbi:tetratricopeptide repeat protein [Actinomycetospora sp. CA-101289]|uniref:tetratricopeptide repeat protein n=1 Tax=Actinomycetospora sp. CA-101289 TaxID=3239893 RepID=UPI003D984CEA